MKSSAHMKDVLQRRYGSVKISYKRRVFPEDNRSIKASRKIRFSKGNIPLFVLLEDNALAHQNKDG